MAITEGHETNCSNGSDIRVSKNCCMRNVNIRNFRIWHFSDLANESSVGLLCGVERTFLRV